MALNPRSPSLTALKIATRSAHMVRPYVAFSTLQPPQILPEALRDAAPTRKLQYGAHASSIAFLAAPMSKSFCLGAALRSTSGRIFGGCNVENATYGLTVCAERVAIFKAISEGERGFDAIAVVTDTDALTSPCGACRQLIWEFCGDVPVILSNLKGKVEVVQMRNFFPKPFDASSL